MKKYSADAMTKSMSQIFEIWFNKKNVGQNVELKKKSKMRKSWPVILSYLSRTAQGYLRQCGLVVHRIHILHTSWGWFQSLLPWGKLGDRIFSNGFRLQLHREVCSSNKLVFFYLHVQVSKNCEHRVESILLSNWSSGAKTGILINYHMTLNY